MSDQTHDERQELKQRLSFWRWFWRVGLRRFKSWWLFFHVAVGVSLDLVAPVPLQPTATTVLLPVAAILVGLTFAWAGNVAGLLQSEELQEIERQDEGSTFDVYVFSYQAAILLVLCTIIAWTLLAMGAFTPSAVVSPGWLRHVARGLLFALSSLTVRECWHAVVGVHAMLLQNVIIRRRKRAKELRSTQKVPPKVSVQLPPQTVDVQSVAPADTESAAKKVRS